MMFILVKFVEILGRVRWSCMWGYLGKKCDDCVGY